MPDEQFHPHVLIVDDDEGNRYAMTRILASAGFRVSEAGTGGDGLRIARNALPDLIVLDVKLPDMNGFDVCRMLKREEITRHIPVLQTSASFVRSEDQVRGLEGGADGYLVQPVDRPVLVATIHSLLRARRAEQEAEKAKVAAEVANAAKDRFLAILSHELRTPLTPALMAVSAMEADAGFPDAYREDIRMIRRSIELETRLIDDLLDLTRVAQGKLNLACREVDAVEMLRSTLDICMPEAAEKKINLGLRVEATQTHVLGDPARLQQVFWNLIKNAIKFTHPGGQVDVTCANVPADGMPRLLIRVADTGIGIEPAVMERLFEPFNQGNGAGRAFGGLGLGLAISRNLVELHGGSIRADSEGLARGATFTVEFGTIPAPVRETPAVSVPATAEEPAALDILLVEDHADSARMLARLLRAMGHRVRTAGSVAEAVQSGEDHVDLLISDIGLPDGTGLDVINALRARQPVRAIALSGYGSEVDLQRSTEAGFAAHLVKPVDLDALRTAIAAVTAGTPADVPA